MNLLKTAYDSSYYDTFNERRLFQSVEIKNKVAFIKQFRSSGTLLELGCGEGKLLQALSADFTVQGIEISPYCIRATNTLLGKRVAARCDIEKTFPTGQFDVIVAFDVLEHLHDPKTTMQAMYDHLRPNGLFIVTVPNNFGLVGSLATACFNFIDRTHVSTWHRHVWEKTLAEIAPRSESWDQVVYLFSHNPLARYVSFDYAGVAFKG